MDSSECFNGKECQPIDDILDVLRWRKPKVCWSVLVQKLTKRTEYCTSSYPACSEDHKPTFQRSTLVPKTLVCHDMKGGYLADRWVNGTDNPDEYKFLYWSCIDIFVYFSHKLVTIPPLCWINAGHTHGVKVLGTILTEGPKGFELWSNLAAYERKLEEFAIRLAEICDHYGFDGYLVNIENPMSQQVMESFVSFLDLLIRHLKNISVDKTIIWYDAVTFPSGKLEWQNRLNNLNRKFFDMCDGIFLNYGWSDGDLIETTLESGYRKADVYVGIDVFGRGCYGGGGFGTCEAMDIIREHGLSAAIFAPGWTYEKCEPEDLVDRRDYMFWDLLSEYLYNYGPARLPFKTSFCRGYGYKKYKEGEVISDQSWFNHSEINYLPALMSGIFDLEESGCFMYYRDDAYDGGGCLLIKQDMSTMGKHCDRLLLCDFSIQNGMKIHIKLASKPLYPVVECTTLFDLVLTMVDHEDCDNHSDRTLLRKLCLPVITHVKPGDCPSKWVMSDFIFEIGCAHIISIDCRLICDMTPVLIGYLSVSGEDDDPAGSEYEELPLNGNHSGVLYCTKIIPKNLICDDVRERDV